MTGPEGIGKTRLALEYAERYRAEYDLVWFVHADSPDAARIDLGHLAETLGLVDRELRESAAAVRAALGWLADHDDWLLIYDNAGDPRDYWLPPRSGHLVVTTSHPIWMPEAEGVVVPPLEIQGAVEFLMDQGAEGNRGTAERLAVTFGGLPLALTLAASLARGLGSLDAVLDLLVAKGPGGRSQVLTKLLTSWMGLLREEPEASRLLILGSQLSSYGIPLGWFDDSLHAKDSQEPDSEWTDHQGAAVLAERSLLTFQDDKASIHPLIQKAVRAALSTDQHVAALQEAVDLVIRELDQTERAGQLPSHHHLCHAETVAFRLVTTADKRLDAARLLDRVGSLRAAREEGATAVRLLSTVVRFLESIGTRQMELVSALEHRATAHLVQGSPESAHRDLQRALRLSEDQLGPEHQRAVDVRERLALFLMNPLNDARGAEEHLMVVLESRLRSLGQAHPSTANALHHLGLARSRLGKLDAARRNLQQALAIRREALGSEHLEVAHSLTNLGVIIAAQGDLGQALDLQRQALEMFERSLGPEHPGLLTVLMNLSGVLRRTGQLAQARCVLDRAWRTARAASGDGGANVGTIRYNLAQVMEELGDSTAAREHYVAMYEAMRAASPPDDPMLQELAEKIA